MAYEKGHTKVGGRQKGTRNKNTEIRDMLRDFTREKFPDFVENYEKLSPKDKTNMYMKVVEYVVPKVSAIKFEDAKNTNNAIELLRITAGYNDED